MTGEEQKRPSKAFRCATRTRGHHCCELLPYLRARLSQPRLIDHLAEIVHARLHAQCASAADPLIQLHTIAARVLVELACSTKEEGRSPRLEKAGSSNASDSLRGDSSAVRPRGISAPDIERVVAQLPTTHAAALLAHTRDELTYEQISLRLCISEEAVEKYVSQARSLVRAFAAMSDDCSAPPTLVIARDEIFAAQHAAIWLGRLDSELTQDREGLLRWLRRSALHVREMLLALAWDSQLSSCPEGGLRSGPKTTVLSD